LRTRHQVFGVASRDKRVLNLPNVPEPTSNELQIPVRSTSQPRRILDMSSRLVLRLLRHPAVHTTLPTGTERSWPVEIVRHGFRSAPIRSPRALILGYAGTWQVRHAAAKVQAASIKHASSMPMDNLSSTTTLPVRRSQAVVRGPTTRLRATHTPGFRMIPTTHAPDVVGKAESDAAVRHLNS
jgi:hypothetical protein